jgi:hypothetical protein
MLLIDFLNNLLVGEQHIKDVTYLDKDISLKFRIYPIHLLDSL